MKNCKIELCLLLLLFTQVGFGNPAIYSPSGILKLSDIDRIKREALVVIANRPVGGQQLLIQIDFMPQNEFKQAGSSGRDENTGRTVFSIGTYAKRSTDYYSQPAVLMLFVEEGENKYRLENFGFSDFLMDNGIPDLVRRYIRDEIMKKEESYVEMISKSLYAIDEALNQDYKDRLITEHIGLFSGNQFKRRHSYYVPFNYYEFIPIHSEYVGNLPNALRFVDNQEYFDWSAIEYTEEEDLDLTIDYKQNPPWYNEELNLKITTPNLRSIIDHPRTAEDNEVLITNLFKKDLIEIANNPIHQDNEDFSSHDANLLSLYQGKYPTLIKSEFRFDLYGCRITIFKKTLDTQWDYIPDVVNRAIYPTWGPKGPTWCNQYIRALSKIIFNNFIFSSLSANELHDFFETSNDFLRLNYGENQFIDPAELIEIGFVIFFVKKASEGSGHVEIGLPASITSVDNNGDLIQLPNNVNFTIGAGATLGAKQGYFSDNDFDKFLYLGHLKQQL